MRNKSSVIHFDEPHFFQQRFYAASFLQHSVDSRRAVTFVATLQLIELPTHTKQLCLWSLLTAVFSIGIVRIFQRGVHTLSKWGYSFTFCYTDSAPPPPCTINYIPPAVSPFNPSSTPPPPKKTHPLSFNLCFLGYPRCINALRNGETSLKNWNCSSLESLHSRAKSLKYRKVQSAWFSFSGRFGNPYSRLGDLFLMRETPG